MRVPDSALSNLTLRGISDRRSDYMTAQRRALTGKRVEKPSDDPVAAARARKFQKQKAEAESHERAGEQVRTSLYATDDAMSQLSSSMRRVREIATQASNDTLSSRERADLATEVQEIENHIAGLANTKAGGRYIFGGYQDNAPPFDATNTYQGDPNVQQVVVGRGVQVALGVSGDRVFATGGPDDVFTALDTLKQGLSTNDKTLIHDGLERSSAAEDNITTRWAEVGSQMQTLDVAGAVADRAKAHAVESLAAETEMDPFEALSGLSNAQQALAAAVQIASMLPTPGLVG